MNTKFTIKNFRVFDEDGETLDIKPITILTGCNNSGKSTVVKGLSLLCDYISSLKQDKENGKKIKLTGHELDFSKKPNNLLGKLAKVVNNNSTDNTVTLGVRVHSLMLAQDVDVDFDFSVEDDNYNGIVTAVSIKKLDGTVIFKSTKENVCEGNLYSILPEFMHFAKVQSLISDFQVADIDRVLGLNDNAMGDEEFEEYSKGVNKYLLDFKSKYGGNVLLDINNWNNLHRSFGSYLSEYSNNPSEILSKLEYEGILYYLPILDFKLSGTKEECIEYLKECIEKEGNKALFITLKKIVTSFTESPFKDFKSFYKNMEKEYLLHFVKVFAFPKNEDKPHLFNSNELTIKGQEIAFNDIDGEWFSLVKGKLSAEKNKEIKEKNLNRWLNKPLIFPNVFESLAILSGSCNDLTYYSRPNDREDIMEFSSKTEYIFFKFIEDVVNEIVVDDTPSSINYVSSSIINIKRLYPVESDDEFTRMLKRYMRAKRNLNDDMKYTAGSFLNRWLGKDHFDICQRISIEVDNEGLGITLRLYKNEEDHEGSLLADSGYGITQLFAILLNIEIAIMERKSLEMIPNKEISAFANKEKFLLPTTIAIEEPEIHLHPNYQAMLAEMFAEAYREYGIHFIIETHSEYLIRKLQTLVVPSAKEKKIDRQQISIIYINDADSSKRKFGDPHVLQIGIRQNGTLDKNFGSGFFDQALINIRELQKDE